MKEFFKDLFMLIFYSTKVVISVSILGLALMGVVKLLMG